MYTKSDMKASQHIVLFYNYFEQDDEYNVVKLIERNMMSETNIEPYNNMYYFDLVSTCLSFFCCTSFAMRMT